MSLSDQQFEFLKDVALLIQFAVSKGWKVTGGELQRTPAQQEIYVNEGKSKTMESLHIKKLAIDLNFFTPKGSLTYDKEDLQMFGDFWESLNEQNRWGGNFNTFLDTPHFQRNEQ